MNAWFITPAAGVGRRFGGLVPKQYATIAGKTIVEHTLERLVALNPQGIVVPLSADDPWWGQLAIRHHALIHTVSGGAERADSVANALAYLDNRLAVDAWVLVHDIARPCVRGVEIQAMWAALETSAVGGILAAPVSDTLKVVDGAGAIVATQDRRQLWAAMTPQMFRFGLLQDALAEAQAQGVVVTDEAMAMELAGHRPQVVAGSRDNIKITQPEDIAIAETILRWQALG
jgi:2-C-methyl-D-erythritol 4-phosphate cytidylyltransferase